MAISVSILLTDEKQLRLADVVACSVADVEGVSTGITSSVDEMVPV